MSRLPSMDSGPMASPCGSTDQLSHLTTEEQEMDIESVDTPGEINGHLVSLVDADIEESSDYYTEHGSMNPPNRSKEASHFLKDEEPTEAFAIAMEEEMLSTSPESHAQHSIVSKVAGIAAEISDAEGRNDYPSEIPGCSGMDNTGSLESLCISALRAACNSVLGVQVDEECTEEPVNEVSTEQLGCGGAEMEPAGGPSTPAVATANFMEAMSMPGDSNLVLLTRGELVAYMTARMHQCLAAEHMAMLKPIEKKFSALQKALIRWRDRAMELRRQIQDLIATENRRSALQHRPQKRSVGVLVRLRSPERKQTPAPPAMAAPPVVTRGASSVALAAKFVTAPPPAYKFPYRSPHLVEHAAPTVTHSTLPAKLRLSTPCLGATTGNITQPTKMTSAGMTARLPPAEQHLPPFSSAMATKPTPVSAVLASTATPLVSTVTVPVRIAAPQVPRAAVPVSTAPPPVLMPSLPVNGQGPAVIMGAPPVAMEQPASQNFFNPTMVVENSSSDSPTNPPLKVLHMPRKMVAAANAAMLEAGAIGMLVQLRSTNEEQTSFVPFVAAPPATMAQPLVMQGPPVTTATPPVAMPTHGVAPSVTMAATIATPVSSSRSAYPSVTVPASIGASETSSLTPTQQMVVTATNTTPSTMNAPLSTPEPQTIHVIIDTTNGTPAPNELGPLGRVVRLAPSQLQKLVSASSVATLPVPVAAPPVSMATPASCLSYTSPSSVPPILATTDTSSLQNCSMLRKLLMKEEANGVRSSSTALPGIVPFWPTAPRPTAARPTPARSKPARSKPARSTPARPTPARLMTARPIPAQPMPACSRIATQITSLTASKVIDLTKEEESESTPIRVIPGTGMSILLNTSGMQQASVSVVPASKTTPTTLTQIPTLSSQPASAKRARVPGPSTKPKIPGANTVWQPAGKVAELGLPLAKLPARVKYYMPGCMVMAPQVPGVHPAASDALQQPVPATLVPVCSPEGSPSVAAGGTLLAPACDLRSPSGTLATNSTAGAAKGTWPKSQVDEGTSPGLPGVNSHPVTNVTWSHSTQSSCQGAIMHSSSQSPSLATTSSLSSVASPCCIEMGEVDVPIFAPVEADVCDAGHHKRTATFQRRKKLSTASPVMKVPKSGAQRIREFREQLKAKMLTNDSRAVDQQVQQRKLPGGSDHADTMVIEQVADDDVDLILGCESHSED